jgi:hypothetical protein
MNSAIKSEAATNSAMLSALNAVLWSGESSDDSLHGLDRVDHRLLLAVLHEHEILPLFFDRAQKLAAFDTLPEAFRMELKQHATRLKMRSLHLMGELHNLLNASAELGLPVIPLKGPLLGQRLFGDPGVRFVRDLDLLLPDWALRPFHDYLLQQGYKIDPADPAARDIDWNHPASNPHEHHLPPLFHDDLKISVELHWSLSPRSYFQDVPTSWLWKSTHEAALANGTQYQQLDMPALLLVLAHHASRHFWSRMKWVADFATAVDQVPPDELQAACRAADEFGLRRLLFSGLQLIHELAGTPSLADIGIDPQVDQRQIDWLAARYRQNLIDGHDETLLGPRAVFTRWRTPLTSRDHFADRAAVLTSHLLERLLPLECFL